ncbi:MAG: 30S ribosomal protein S12 methylthiotransferase RimO, partial [bacterium]
MRVKLVTLGCAKNLVDSEYIAGGLQSSGVEFTDDTEDIDALIINTCGFIESAKEESIDTIFDAVALKKQGKCSKVIVTGCLSQRYGPDLRMEIPELDGIYGNRNLKRIVQEIALQLNLQQELLGERQLLSPRHYAYLKISEGCEHPCTFCAIPGIRGNFQSKPIETLVDESRMLAEKGVKELVLIAQDSTVYGQDIYGEKKLPDLLRALSQVEAIEWIRLMYAYPYSMTDELIATIAETEKVCNYLDMPVQHVSDFMLKRMARRVTGKKQHGLIEKLRRSIPGFALRTSVIVGFPGETAADFAQLYDYVSEGHFDRLGVFVYSQEEDTPAATFPGQVPENIKRERQDLLIQAQDSVTLEKNNALRGKEV